MKYTLEQKFKTLCQITRASHFEWRQTIIEMFPDIDPKEAILKYWEIVGKDTAKAYIKKIDRTRPIAHQIVELIADSSHAMGENANYRINENGTAQLEHLACPWLEWHIRYDALSEDQPGCDKWIETLVKEINKEFGTNIRFETLSSLPDGSRSCMRIFYEE